MVGSGTHQRPTNSNKVLNAVCDEGWSLVSGSFVFVERGHQSRDKFLSSGQQVAIKGEVRAYYLFRRDESLLAPF
jgi:hypothetical protein